MVTNKRIPYWQRIVVRLQLLYNLPLTIIDGLKFTPIKSALHDGERELTGEKEIAYVGNIDFDSIRSASKKLGVTINDLFTAALSIAVKKYQAKRGDKNDSMNICIPISLRWEFYPTRESVCMENKIGAYPMNIALEENPEDALKKVSKVTRKMKERFGKMYATYIFGIVCGWFVPEFVMKATSGALTLPYTMAFSNTPGVVKAPVINGVKLESLVPFLIPSGKVGLGIGCMSFAGKFTLSITADKSLGVDVQELINEIAKATKLYV